MQHLREEYVKNLCVSIANLGDNEFSNCHAIHVSGTEAQSDSILWHEQRRWRITASKVKQLITNPKSIANLLWKEVYDLSHVPAIKWGRNNEGLARETYKNITNKEVTEVGLFISRSAPLFGASPDGLLDEGAGILEIKCPFGLRNSDLKDVKDTTVFTVHNGVISLRRTHSYFYQCQFAMFVTGARYCDFFI